MGKILHHTISYLSDGREASPKIPVLLYVGVAVILASYLGCVALRWEFFYFLILFCLAVAVTAVINFEAAFLFVPLVLMNPYTLTETGTNLRLSELVLVILFVIWIGRIFLLKESIAIPKPFLALSLLIIIPSAISLVRAPYLAAGVKQVVRFIELFLIFFSVVLYTATSEKRIKQIFISLIVGGLITSSISIGQYIGNVLLFRESTRALGWHGGDNGAFLASTIILAFSALSYAKEGALKILALITIPVAGLALLLSQTRAWIGAFILVLGLMFFMQRRGSFKKLFIVIGLLFGVIFLIVQTDAFGLVDKNFFLNAFKGASRFGKNPGEYSAFDMSLLMRFNAWRKAIEIYLSHPFFGYGIGNIRISDYFTSKLGRPVEGVGYVDNQYLQFFAEAGTIAGVALILYIAHAVRIAVRSYRNSLGSTLGVPAFGFFGCLMICVIGSGFWVITIDHELFALMIMYLGLLIKINDLSISASMNTSITSIQKRPVGQ